MNFWWFDSTQLNSLTTWLAHSKHNWTSSCIPPGQWVSCSWKSGEMSQFWGPKIDNFSNFLIYTILYLNAKYAIQSPTTSQISHCEAPQWVKWVKKFGFLVKWLDLASQILTQLDLWEALFPTLEVSWSPKLLNPPFTTTVGLQPVRSGPAWTSPGPGSVWSTVQTDGLLDWPSLDQQPPGPDQTDWRIIYLV